MKDKVKTLFTSTKFITALAALVVITLSELGIANLDQDTIANALKLGLVVLVGHSATEALSNINNKIEDNNKPEEKEKVETK